jgi:hypothetical protein
MKKRTFSGIIIQKKVVNVWILAEASPSIPSWKDSKYSKLETTIKIAAEVSYIP